MELTFDYFRNAQDVELYLCNPNKAILGTFVAKNRNLTLRFNDISELSFEVPKYISTNTEENVEQPYYSRIATRRLIKIDKIGYFKIKEAVELENAEGAYKTVTAESHQCVFKDMGFVTENRLYKFYDENDPYDEKYDAANEKHIPSVVGQLHQQLGILCDLTIGDVTPSQDYDDWKIIWIEPALYYDESNETNVCRTLKANEELFGYDFMVGDVGNAFQVFFEFDFLHHTIKVKGTSTIAQKTNIYLSFENLIQELNLEEKSEDIVTVLACEGGNGMDITSVNPMGTNYICDFSYYMGNDVDGYPWMSKELTDKLKLWQQTVANLEPQYSSYVSQLQDLYLVIAEYESEKAYIEQKLQDTDNARDQYITNPEENGGFTFVGEAVAVGEKSRISTSDYYSTPFSGDDTCTCYKEPPVYDAETGVFSFSAGAESMTGTFTECFTAYFDSNNPDDIPFYFMDGATNTYCKITGKISVDENDEIVVDENGDPVYEAGGFERYALYRDSGFWCNAYSAEEASLQARIDEKMGDETNPSAETVRYIEKAMEAIAEQANIINQFADSPNLLRELKCYWIDGKYTNDTIEKLDETTVAENLGLAKELMDAAKVELARVCQPRFSFEVTSANFLKIYQFVKFAEELALGKVVTIEKNESVHYYPALTEMSFSSDVADDFTLVFSNSLKLTDWGYTYADLIKSLSDTARTVSSNWNDLMDYSENKETINKMLVNTLDRTLRVGMANAYNQEFIVDNTGILGRKLNESGTYDNEQLRMINNLLLFTRDNWQTASTALGKISYEKPDGTLSEGYGLATEVLVGAMIIGDNLWIGNETNSVKIDKDGIVISSGSISSADYSDNEANYPYSLSGIKIDLGNEPYIKTPSFALESNGDAYFKGDVTAENLTLNIDAAIGGALQSKNFALVDPETYTQDVEVTSTVISTSTTGTTLNSGYRYTIVEVTGSITVPGTIQAVNSFTVNSSTLDDRTTGHTLVKLLYTQPTYTISGNVIAFTFRSRYRCSKTYALSAIVSSCNVSVDISELRAKSGLKIKFGEAPYILSPNFSVNTEGLISATNANIEGVINATSGTVGAFTITADGLESEHIKLNSQSIYFPTQSVFNLSNDVTIFNEDATSYIATTGTRDFEIKNIGGAGIRFAANSADENVYQAITLGAFTVKTHVWTEDLGEGYYYDHYSYTLDFPYSISGNGVLLSPLSFTIYVRYTHDYPGAAFGIGAYVKTENIAITVDIPALVNSGTFSKSLGLSMKSSQLTVHGVCKTNSTTNSDYSMNAISFENIVIETTNNILYSLGSFCPNTTATASSGYLLGDDSHVWRTVRAYTASITTSDRREKNNICALKDEHDVFFDDLKPVTFVYEHADTGRTHLGFIAQDVESSLLSAGLTTMDFAGVCIGNDENKTYGLRYEEFIALNTSQIQKLKIRVAELEKELREIKGNET